MNSDELKLKKLNSLRGLFAIEVIIGHAVRYENGILSPFGKFMICSVAFFFFVSAFGMAVSYHKKPNYLGKSFLISKFIYIMLVAMAAYIINIGISFIFRLKTGYCNNIFSPVHFFKYTNWYLWELLGFYLLFWVIYRFINRFRIVSIVIISLVAAVVMYYLGFTENWVASVMGFPLGIIVGECYGRAESFLYSVKGYITCILLGIFGVCSLIIGKESLLTIVFMRNAICIAVIIICIYLCEIKWISENPLARLLNKYSTELYLSQFVWLEHLYNQSGWNYYLMVAFMLSTSIITALLLYAPAIKLIKKILNK